MAAGDGARHFAYARSLTPMLLVLVGLALVEAAIVHLLVALLWSPWAALALSLASAAGVAWLVMLVRSFGTMPVTIDGEDVVMRAGRLKAIRFRRADVRAIGSEIDAAALKLPSVLRLSLLAHPNVVVEFVRPIPLGRRQIGRVAHRLDDPAAFTAALGGDRADA